MGKKQNQIYQLLLQSIQNMQKPENNPAQNYLTQEALDAGDYFKKGDFSSLPKGMVFDFNTPGKDVDAYKKAVNVGQGGTFALGDNAGMGKSMATQNMFLQDKFARDADQNYQDNIRGAATGARNMLGQAAGAKGATDSNVISALQNLYGSPALNRPGIGGQLLGAIGGIAGGALSSMKPWSI